MQQDNTYVTIDFMKVVNGMIRRVWAIILSMVICGVIAFSWASYFVTPQYQANILMYVNNSSFSVGSTSFSISSSEISAAKSLVDTYIVILKTRMTLSEVISTARLDYSYSELVEMIEAESVDGTEVFSVTVTSPSPQEAEHIANTIGLILPEKIASVVEGSSVRIVDYAVIPEKKASPNVIIYTIVGLLLGMVISMVAIAVMEVLDDQIHSEEYLLTNYKDIPLLSAIPDMMGEHKGGYYNSYYSEAALKKARRNSTRKAGDNK